MKVKLKKWGNSVGLRLPKLVLAEAKLREGSEVEIEFSQDGLKVLKTSDSLETLCDAITDENLHSETDWGKKEGKEEW